MFECFPNNNNNNNNNSVIDLNQQSAVISQVSFFFKSSDFSVMCLIFYPEFWIDYFPSQSLFVPI